MSIKEKTKILIDFIKTAIFALLTALFGIFAWIVINIKSIILLQAITIIIGIIFIFIAFYILIKYLIKLLKDLENME